MLSADFPRYALTELTIYGDDYEQWVEFLAELPCIEKLRIQSHDYAEYEANEDDCKISCNSLEKIHNCLPRLRYLCIDPYISFGNMPESIVPCDTVRELALTLVRGRPWGEYLAQKYTHLEKLYIGDLLSHDEDSLEQLCAFATGCTHLREFDSDEIRTYRPFLDALSNVGAPIRELRFDLWDQQWVVDKLDKFKQTCTSVRLRLQKETLGWPVFGAFAPYLSLTHLTVDIHYGEMELDKILSQIEQIRHLSVTAQDFCVGRDRKRDLRHNLDTLYLQGCINDQVYVYLSECCPRLSRLQCTYADAYRESCVIYCPNTSLKKLSITLSGDYVFKLAKIEDRNGSKNNNNESPRVSQNAKSSTRWLLHGTYYNSFESLEASGLSKMSWRKAQATENKRIFPMNIASIHYRHIASMELKSATASRFNKVQ
ncbi:hypothetical protein EC973_005876 [Apophysomyces ossiformis]|uniref:Uncharacterized protein n=1 Tax=Apophysomyces ossiformis TaxID=679940 RepID=A0A8H7BK03_9FUNG|nr:hypothetical protein EC973_005876 [Apophysomyces ossiformis]